MASDFLDRLETIAKQLGVRAIVPLLPSNPRPDLQHCLQLLHAAIAYHEPRHHSMTSDEFVEYAIRRLVRDQYMRGPKALANDLRNYLLDYHGWWEQWRRK